MECSCLGGRSSSLRSLDGALKGGERLMGLAQLAKRRSRPQGLMPAHGTVHQRCMEGLWLVLCSFWAAESPQCYPRVEVG